MKLYAAMTDEQLQALARDRQSGAEEALAERYVRLVRMCARPYFLAEGMLGLLSAIREYDSGKGVRFKTYAEVCVKNRIQSAIRSASRKKHAPLNDGVSFDEVLSDESQSLGTHYYQRSPEEQVLARESEREFISAYSRCLSKLETQVLGLYLDGLSYQEMASVLKRDVKAVDNAVQRIRKKLANLPSGENSVS
jgi:RNA polymerase sporulation-specific sigma factor